MSWMSHKKEMAKRIGLNIQRRRLELEMTQLELAEKLYYHTGASISNFESGRRAPGPTILHRLAEALNCTTDYLLKEPS